MSKKKSTDFTKKALLLWNGNCDNHQNQNRAYFDQSLNCIKIDEICT